MEGRGAEAPPRNQAYDSSPASRVPEYIIRFDAARFAQIGAQYGVQAASPCSQKNAENKINFVGPVFLIPNTEISKLTAEVMLIHHNCVGPPLVLHFPTHVLAGSNQVSRLLWCCWSNADLTAFR